MSSLSFSINGVPACANQELLTDILRNEWKFTGYVVSDQGAIEMIISNHHYYNNSVDTVAGCVNAGVNLELSNNLQTPVFFSLGWSLFSVCLRASTLFLVIVLSLFRYYRTISNTTSTVLTTSPTPQLYTFVEFKF